jgi:hypothetical protein
MTDPNKYLEKIAGWASINKGFSRAADYLHRVSGATNREAQSFARHVAEAEAKGINAKAAFQAAENRRREMIASRLKTGLGAGLAGTTGLLGLHKYHQHKDQAIMDKLNAVHGIQFDYQ